MKTKHSHEVMLASQDCLRCNTVREVLKRYKLNPGLFNMGDRVWQLAEHAVDLEEVTIEYREKRAPYAVSGASNDNTLWFPPKLLERTVDAYNKLHKVEIQLGTYLSDPLKKDLQDAVSVLRELVGEEDQS